MHILQDARGTDCARSEGSRHDPDGMATETMTDVDVQLWRLEEVAEAAREIPLEKQPPRLQSALARLVEIPREASGTFTQEDQPSRD